MIVFFSHRKKTREFVSQNFAPWQTPYATPPPPPKSKRIPNQACTGLQPLEAHPGVPRQQPAEAHPGPSPSDPLDALARATLLCTHNLTFSRNEPRPELMGYFRDPLPIGGEIPITGSEPGSVPPPNSLSPIVLVKRAWIQGIYSAIKLRNKSRTGTIRK